MELNNKIIIHNYTQYDDIQVMEYVGKVVRSGKLSHTFEGDQYCFVSCFKSGVVVSCTRKNNTYTFKVAYDNKEDGI